MNLSNTSIVAGAGVALYNGYRLLTVKGPEAQSQRRTALLGMAVGIAVLSVGLSMNEGKTLEIAQEAPSLNDLMQSAKDETKSSIANLTEAMKFASVEASCPIASLAEAEAICPSACPTAALTEALQSKDTHFVMSRSFKALNATLGISCENYLGWKSEFSKRIKLEDMHKPVMWGFTGEGNPFLAIKTACEQIKSTSSNNVNGADVTLLLQNGHTSRTHEFYGANCLPNLARQIDFFLGLKKAFKVPEILSVLFENKTAIGSDLASNHITKLTLLST